MIITECDGCGERSPNKDGYHIANSWIRLWIKDGVLQNRVFSDIPDKILCEKCWGRTETAMLANKIKEITNA